MAGVEGLLVTTILSLGVGVGVGRSPIRRGRRESGWLVGCVVRW